MKSERKRGKKRWILWAVAAVAAIVVGVLAYDNGGGGSRVAEIPGGFELTAAVLERDGSVTLYSTRDDSEIQAVQSYIRQREARRLRARSGVKPDYPFLSLYDGTGKTARRAVWAGGVWLDGRGMAYEIALDPAELVALMPGAETRTGMLVDFPNRALAASLSGAWDARLLLRAPQPLGEDTLVTRARERSDEKLSVTVYNPRPTALTCRTDVQLQAESDGVWYAVPADAVEDASPEETRLEPEASALFTVTTTEVEERYGKLIPGHYRLVLLTYDAEFDVE